MDFCELPNNDEAYDFVTDAFSTWLSIVFLYGTTFFNDHGSNDGVGDCKYVYLCPCIYYSVFVLRLKHFTERNKL